MNSTFRMPLIIQPQPPPTHSETLLFNDILEEKITLLRNTFTEFLQVQSYQKFNAEFSNFLKRSKRIIQEGHRNGSNFSRMISSTDITPFFSRPSASLYRPQTALSAIGSSSRSAFKAPVPTEQSNNLPQNPEVNIQPTNQPTVHLSRDDNNTCSTSSFQPNVISSTVNENAQEENQPSTSAAFTNSTNNQSPAVSDKNTISKRNSYSDVTVIENKLEDSQKDDGSNSIESLLGNAGFKIDIGKIDESNISKNKDKVNEKNKEKYLSKWSVNLKRIKLVHKSKICLAITGSLLSDDRNTIKERFHDAGYLEGRKENNLIKTTNGIYNLIGNIIGGSPNELYHVCLEVRGIPRTWRQIVNKLTNNERDKRNETLNFTLESPAGPSNARKNDVKSNLHMNEETNAKRKRSESDLTENHKSKQRKLTKQLTPLMASTPFKAKKKDTMFETPSQMKSQKNKVNENLHRTRNSTRNTINGTGKGLLKDQSIASLKRKTPEKTLLNSNSRTNSSKRVLGNSTKGSSVISSKQTSLVNNSKLVIKKTPENDKSTKSVKIVNRKQLTLAKNSKLVIKTPENDVSTESIKVVNREPPTLTKNSKQAIKTPENDKFTNNVKVVNCKQPSLVNKSKVVSKTPENDKSTKNVKVVNRKQPSLVNKSKVVSKTLTLAKNSKQVIKTPENKKSTKSEKVVKDKKNITLSLKKSTKNKITKVTKQKEKNSSERKVSAKKEKKNKLEMKKKQANTSRGEIGLFDNIDYSAYGDLSDFNIMASPTKLTSTSCTETSRSETPPLFGHQWSSSGKSIAMSEGPSLLCKSIEAKALKRVKAPKFTLEEELKNNRRTNNKQSIDYKKVTNQINQMLQFGEQYDRDDDSFFDSVI
ncbi:Hypothetical protein CINCED_3A020446 [Cinara cedri]|uniref:SANTA domain-containing protein n=1 Tax=Cinara cedri TaxID=506608 RepID=A0A5E4NSR7_9HEMI|nr:Hypothetical protein CINCED_3A020446 [Cinara cedri]